MKNYFVLYERWVKTEQEKKYGARQLYASKKEFQKFPLAVRFATQKVPVLVVARLPLTKEAGQFVKQADTNYVVAAEFLSKYSHTDYSGDTEGLHTWDVIKCKQSELEATVEMLAREENNERGPWVKGILVGLEVDIFTHGVKK
ncbi:MAG: hypothetical protein HY438_00910 [DPANN group archaeon]|nr:hypothetical protein [DPANN group archaeon]